MRFHLQRRGRAALLWGLTTFLLGQMGLALAIEFALPELRDPEYGIRVRLLEQRYRANSERAARPLTIVVLGSSRTTFGMRADLVEGELRGVVNRPVLVFNFGITGGGPFLELLQFRRLLQEEIRPDLLVVEVVPPFLAGQVAQGVGRLPVGRFRLYELASLQSHGGSAEQTPFRWWQSWLVPGYSHRFELLSRLAPSLVPDRSRMDWLFNLDGCGCITARSSRAVSADPAAAERTRGEYAPYFAGFQLAGASSTALKELLALCRQEQIPAALVWMPEGAGFRKQYPAAMLSEVQSFLAELSSVFAAPLLDCREWADDGDFVDAHHLTSTGATRFSTRFARETLVPLLRVSLRPDQCSN